MTQSWPAAMAALVPVYNHVLAVGAVVRFLRELGAPLVLAVDDGSTDGSGAAAREAGAELLVHPQNQGKAAALRSGFAELNRRGFRQALTCDADGQHPPEAVARLLGAAAVRPEALWIGVRRMGHAPWASRTGRRCSNAVVRGVCGVNPGDSQSGLRVYPLPMTHELKAPAKRYAYEVEIIARAAWKGVPICTIDVPVLYPQDRVTHFRRLRDNAHAVGVFLRLAGLAVLPPLRR